MKYFKHDSDAAQDAKLRRLRLRYGMTGYGVYWFILELIARNVDKHNLTFELEHDAELIAADTCLHREQVEEMMRYMVELGLFDNANGIIRCLKMASRADEYTQKLLLSARQKPNVPTLSRQYPDSLGILSELREENRKEKKSKSRFAPPTVSDVTEYASEIGVTLDPTTFCDFYASKGWKVGNTTMKDWRAAVRNWARRSGVDKAGEVYR